MLQRHTCDYIWHTRLWSKYVKSEHSSKAGVSFISSFVRSTSNHWKYRMKLSASSSTDHSEGNFRGNQPLNGSISLTPSFHLQQSIPTSEFLRTSTRISFRFILTTIVYHFSGDG